MAIYDHGETASKGTTSAGLLTAVMDLIEGLVWGINYGSVVLYMWQDMEMMVPGEGMGESRNFELVGNKYPR